jgi:hypothetical protein
MQQVKTGRSCKGKGCSNYETLLREFFKELYQSNMHKITFVGS